MSIEDIQLGLAHRLRAAAVELAGAKTAQLSLYFGLMAKWNRILNLTSLQLDPPTPDAIDRILVEPAAAAKLISGDDRLLIDVGSGGGSPAIPLKICAPWLRLVMVESRGRKAAFLRDVARHLSFDDVEVANCRVENLSSRMPGRHLSADIVSVRAVRADQDLWKAAGHLLAPTGRIFWFGSDGGLTHEPPSLAVTERLSLPGASELIVLQRSNRQ